MAKEIVKPATGKLGIMVVGLGAVSTTFMTGVMMTRKGLAKPIGSMTQYDKIRVGKGENKKYLHYNEIVSMPSLDDIVFAAWDVYPVNAYESAINAEVLKEKDIEPVKDELLKIKPLKAAFDKNYAKRLDGDNVKQCKDRWDMTEQVREDIRNFKQETGVDRVVVLWAASTEIYVEPDMKYHGTIAALEQAMKDNVVDKIAPSMCYAYAALMEDCPFIMGAMILHVGLDIDLGGCGPEDNDAVNAGLLLEVADILANLLSHVPAVLALLHVVAVQTLSIVPVESGLEGLNLDQLVLNGVNILLLEHLGIDSALISVDGEYVPSGKHDVVEAGHRDDFIIM